MKYLYKIVMRYKLILISFLTTCIPSLVGASFSNSFNTGSPDLAVSSLEQRSANTFIVTICNVGDTATGNARILVRLTSNEGLSEDRTYSNQSLSSGECRSLVMQSVDGYTTATKRKSTVTVRISLEGNIREVVQRNNSLYLLPKRFLIDASTLNSRNQRSTDPVADLWGSDTANTRWYDAAETRTTYNNSTNYNNSSIYNTSNGDFDPAGPTWAMRQAAQNVIYVSNGPGSGYWYNGVVTSNGNYVYSPYNSPYIGGNGYPYYGNNYFPNNTPYNTPFVSTNTYNNSGNNSFVSTNLYSNTPPTPFVSTNAYSNTPPTPFVSTNAYNYTTFNPLPPIIRPPSPDIRCTRWEFNSLTGRYEWRCDNGVWNGYGTPDLYMSNLRQNGDRSELLATICNQGDAMGSQAQITLRIGNGNQSATTSSFIQLGRSGCSDIAISTSNFNIFTKPVGVLFYAEIDIYNAVRESREDNNNSYWRLVIN